MLYKWVKISMILNVMLIATDFETENINNFKIKNNINLEVIGVSL